VFVITTGMTYEGLSQRIPDTLCFPVHVIEARLIEVEQGRQLKKLVGSYKEEISKLEKKVDNYQKAIDIHNANKEANQFIISSLEANIVTMKEQRKLYEDSILQLNKSLKRERNKTKAVAITGVILITLALLK
jgi:chromosome segregation ATPase